MIGGMIYDAIIGIIKFLADVVVTIEIGRASCRERV